MHVLICPDKFKGSLTALKAAEAIARGLPPGANYTLHPLADGGEGSLQVIAEHTSGHWVFCQVHDPLFRPIQARYWVSENTAYLEMAQASGLDLLTESERQPCRSTSYGTGELIFNALTAGFRKIVLFIGGSATVDGGMGLLAALGFRFLDEAGNTLSPVAGNLEKIDSWTEPKLGLELTVVCDVTSPLHGELGAAQLFGPQKGASPEQVKFLEKGLLHFEQKVAEKKRISWAHFPGAGAAGGIGWAVLTFLQAQQVSGFDFISRVSQLPEKIEKADLIITGEGKIDDQTWLGKVPDGVYKLAKQWHKPLVAVCGIHEGNSPIPVFDLMSVAPNPQSAMQEASSWLEVLVNSIQTELEEVMNR